MRCEVNVIRSLFISFLLGSCQTPAFAAPNPSLFVLPSSMHPFASFPVASWCNSLHQSPVLIHSLFALHLVLFLVLQPQNCEFAMVSFVSSRAYFIRDCFHQIDSNVHIIRYEAVIGQQFTLDVYLLLPTG
eukprot:1068508_1